VRDNRYKFLKGVRAIEILVAKAGTRTTKTTDLYRACELKLYRHFLSDLPQNSIDSGLFEIHWVDPDEITKYSFSPFGKSEIPYRLGFGKLLGGNWDTGSKPIVPQKDSHFTSLNDYLVIGLLERYSGGEGWDDTTLFDRCREKISDGVAVWRGCESMDQVEQQAKRYDSLFESIKSDGYMTQDDLFPERGLLWNRRNEVLVDISRSGEMLFVDGVHRLMMAKILELDEIPVVVLCRHKQLIENNTSRVLTR